RGFFWLEIHFCNLLTHCAKVVRSKFLNYKYFTKMEVAKKGNRVKVHYTGKLQDGTIFDSSIEREPLEFVVGDGNMIKGFDKAVEGMQKGETVTANIPSSEAYGERRADMMVDVPIDQVPENINPAVGQQLSIQQA